MRQYLEYHPRVGYRYIPDLKARVPSEAGGYLIRTNSEGFRCDREFISERRGKTRRVLLFGDSYTAGDLVSNGKRYSEVLETLVPDLEVYNFGLPGTGTDQQYLAYQEFAKGIDRDLLIIAVLVENIRRVVARFRTYADDRGCLFCYAKPYFVLEGGRLVLQQVPPPREPIPEEALSQADRERVDRGGRLPGLRKLVTRLGAKELLQKLSRYQPVPEYDSPRNPAWKVLRAILLEWVASSPRPVLLLPIPLYHHVEGTSSARAYRRRFSEVANEAGCALHDPLADLAAYPMEERRAFRFQRDVHPTPKGHAALARSLAPVVERLLGGGAESH